MTSVVLGIYVLQWQAGPGAIALAPLANQSGEDVFLVVEVRFRPCVYVFDREFLVIVV